MCRKGGRVNLIKKYIHSNDREIMIMISRRKQIVIGKIYYLNHQIRPLGKIYKFLVMQLNILRMMHLTALIQLQVISRLTTKEIRKEERNTTLKRTGIIHHSRISNTIRYVGRDIKRSFTEKGIKIIYHTMPVRSSGFWSTVGHIRPKEYLKDQIKSILTRQIL